MTTQVKQSYSRLTGIMLVLTAAIFWGVSGVVAQYLIERGYSVEWLVSVRLLSSGFILLLYTRLKTKINIWEIWQFRFDAIRLIIFSIFGMLAVQYTFFAAIQYSNAATATILQYLAPIIIALYITFKSRKLPTRNELFAIILAFIGTFLLVTKGSVGGLSISGWALFWGLGSAFALAFYTLNPNILLARWGSNLIVGWAMIVAGVSFSLYHPPWKFDAILSVNIVVALGFIIIFGTVLAFNFYLLSLKFIRPSEASILASAEPLSAAFISVLWLGVAFGIAEWIGTSLIICTVVLLTLVKKK